MVYRGARMGEYTLYWAMLIAFAGIALVIFVALFFVSAPYGRHARAGFGPGVDATVGWMVMEAPSAIGMIVLYGLSDSRGGAAGVLLLAMWEAHYLHRAFVFPLRRRSRAGQMPFSVAIMAFVFNLVNVYLNGRWLYALGPVLSSAWILEPHFIAGALVFFCGYAINLHADEVLLRLRAPGERGYRVPHGGLYRWVSCPNYLGEILEWCGFALASFSPAAVVFAFWTFANLVPRAWAHHQWYKARFPDYPPERRAIVPFLL